MRPTEVDAYKQRISFKDDKNILVFFFCDVQLWSRKKTNWIVNLNETTQTLYANFN